MTDVNQTPREAAGLPLEGLVVLLAPVMTVVSIIAIAALAAAIADWYRVEMLLVAGGLCGALAAMALVLTYRRKVERETAARQLDEMRARVGGIVESAMDAIITIDESQHIVQFNAAAERMFGWPREAMLGAPLANLLPERFRAAHAKHIELFGHTARTSRSMGNQTVLHALRKDGDEFPIEASISQLTEGGKRLFTVILRDVTQRVEAGEALRRSREELKEFALASNYVREHEKSRIARELHDELGQTLTALKIDLGWLRERLGSAPDVGVKLASMQGLLDATVASARRISADLRPLMLDDLGLVAACEWLVQEFRGRTGIACELRIDGDLDLPDPHATAIFRALQESLTNVAKHAKARRVDVTLARAGGTIRLVVRDNGTGFATEDPRKPDSYGLLGLKERAYLLGGTFSLESAPGEGTRVELNFPEKAPE